MNFLIAEKCRQLPNRTLIILLLQYADDDDVTDAAMGALGMMGLTITTTNTEMLWQCGMRSAYLKLENPTDI